MGVAKLIERAEKALAERMYSSAESDARLALEWYPQEASRFHLVLGHVFMQKTPPRLGVAKWHSMEACNFAQPGIANHIWAEAALAMLEIEKALGDVGCHDSPLDDLLKPPNKLIQKYPGVHLAASHPRAPPLGHLSVHPAEPEPRAETPALDDDEMSDDEAAPAAPAARPIESTPSAAPTPTFGAAPEERRPALGFAIAARHLGFDPEPHAIDEAELDCM